MRQQLVLFVIIFLTIVSCKKSTIHNIESLSKAYSERVSEIDKIKYDARFNITFTRGTVWDKPGTAIIQINQADTIFGFSFWGIRKDVNESAIYKDGTGFHIINNDKKFETEQGGHHFLGRPGGQMIYKDFFTLDSIYEEAIFSMSDTSYLIQYNYENDPKKTITDRTKSIEFDKTLLLPIRIFLSHTPEVGNKQIIIYEFSNILLNDEVDEEIDDFISDLSTYDLVTYEDPGPNKLLNKNIPNLSLVNLMNEDEKISINTRKLTLLDFWEIWCGPCIKSLPDIQRIDSTYGDKLVTIGFVSKNIDNAKELITKRNISLLNLIGTDQLNEQFSVNSWPRYFLIDENGIVLEEYNGYSGNIESDIKEYLRL